MFVSAAVHYNPVCDGWRAPDGSFHVAAAAARRQLADEKAQDFPDKLCATTMKIAKRYVISGRVQAVGYRFFAERVANQLGICGYVKNLWDGNVEVYAIGDEASLEEFKCHLAQGPRSARVTHVEESDEPVTARYKEFVIEGFW